MASTIYELRRELANLKREGEKSRQEARRELVSLRAKLTPLSGNLKKLGGEFDLALYQKAMSKIFSDDCPSPYTLRIQAQLCHVLHCHEIQLKQLQSMKQWNKRIITQLCKEVTNIKDESKARELELANELDRAMNSNKVLQTELDETIKKQEEELMEFRELSPDDLFNLPNEDPYESSFGRLTEVLGPDFDPTLEMTPLMLQKSKIWIDLKQETGRDTNEGELRKMDHRNSAAFSPTRDALKKLSIEVFSLE